MAQILEPPVERQILSEASYFMDALAEYILTKSNLVHGIPLQKSAGSKEKRSMGLFTSSYMSGNIKRAIKAVHALEDEQMICSRYMRKRLYNLLF